MGPAPVSTKAASQLGPETRHVCRITVGLLSCTLTEHSNPEGTTFEGTTDCRRTCKSPGWKKAVRGRRGDTSPLCPVRRRRSALRAFVSSWVSSLGRRAVMRPVSASGRRRKRQNKGGSQGPLSASRGVYSPSHIRRPVPGQGVPMTEAWCFFDLRRRGGDVG